MESFALWNLLKTALSAAQQSSASLSASGEESKTEAQKADESRPTPTEENPPIPNHANACEAYLLRHEAIKSTRKK